MMTACGRCREYSPMVQAVNGAMYCIGAGSDAVAATTIEYSSAPALPAPSRTAQRWNFWPIATRIQPDTLVRLGVERLLVGMVSSAIAVLRSGGRR
jgi:hypothetical protein